MAELRFGRVSSVDYETGRISVYYSDMSKCVTDYLPMVSNGIYIMPRIGAKVAVLHLTHDLSEGIVLGTMWEGSNVPIEASESVIHISFDGTDAYVKYDKLSGILTVKAPVVQVEQDEPDPVEEGGGE